MMTYWPTEEQLWDLGSNTPAPMRPNWMPLVVNVSGFLNTYQCLEITDQARKIAEHKFPGCNAHTTEFTKPLQACFNEVRYLVEYLNNTIWDFDIDEEPMAWMQTYEQGGDYDWHTDAAAGQTRKLTAVIQLSDPESYGGGHLEIESNGQSTNLGKERGTVTVFQSWLRHRVTTVHSGLRQTINLGFYGPPFK